VVAVAVAAAAAIAGVLLLGDSRSPPSSQRSDRSSSGPRTAIALGGVGAYDPYGGDGEHDSEAPQATDGDPATYWETQHYFDGLAKKGVGVVLDAHAAAAAKRLTVSSDTPGFTAMILAGSSATGGFAPDSGARQVGARTTFALQGRKARYYVVWITDLGPHDSVHVNEVAATD
jgi:hypothetical protein